MEEIITKYSKLLNPGMGTENVGPILYSFIQKVRPEKVLEIGLGYTTAFIAESLKKVKNNFEHESKLLSKLHKKTENLEKKDLSIIGNLNPEYYVKPYEPIHICIDDFSMESSTAKLVLDELKKNNFSDKIFVIKSDFRGQSREILNKFGKINLTWFDCGGPPEYKDFISEYWSLVESGGYVLFHFTFSYLFKIDNFEKDNYEKMGRMIKNKKYAEVYAKVKNELSSFLKNKKMKYEIISLVEPHKYRQSSITIVKKL